MNNYDGKRLFGGWYIPDFKKPIGSGSFGTVYELRSYVAKNSVTAVKIISIPRDNAEYLSKLGEVGSSEDEVKKEFCRVKDSLINEIEMMLKVSGFTNCVGCMSYCIEEHEGGCFGWDILIQMEMLESLDAHFRTKGSITNLDIVKLGIDMCHALEACQANNMIHRDIKPSNIMVKKINDNTYYKLGDFGVARILSGSGTMSISGTLNYMAPELLHGAGDLRVDIYSLGIVLYQLLNANRLPFTPDYPREMSTQDETRAHMLCHTDKMKPEPLYAVGTELAGVVLKACEFDPDKRYCTPQEMCKALETVLDSEKEWPIFSVPPIGKYVPSERKVLVKIYGNRLTTSWDGKEHTADGFTTNVKTPGIKVELAAGVSASVRSSKAGRHAMGLTRKSFVVSSGDPSISIADVIVEDGYLELEKAKTIKPLITGVCALAAAAVICAAAFGGGHKDDDAPPTDSLPQSEVKTDNETEEPPAPEDADDNIVKIMLHFEPYETSSYADVKHDAPIIMGRINALAGDVEVTQGEDGSIDAEIPLDTLGTKNDLDSVIRATLSNPLELYFVKVQSYGCSYDENARIERDEILEVKSISAEEANAAYGMPLTYETRYDGEQELPLEQPCLLFKLTPEAAAKSELLAEDEGILSIGTDMDIPMGGMYFPYGYVCDDGVTFIAVATAWPEQALAYAQVFGYANETLNKVYYYSYKLSPSAYWETADTAEYLGEYQCAFDELTGDKVELKFSTYNPDEVSDVSYASALRTFKDKLDIIGLPYAVGTGVQDPRSIVVCTSPERLNSDILKFFTESAPDYLIKSDDVESYNLETESMEIIQNEDTGMYELKVQLDDPALLSETTSQMFKLCTDRSIYLSWYDTDVAAARVDNIIQDGILSFDRLPIALKNEIDEQNKYILELVKYTVEAGYPEVYYSLSDYGFSGDDVHFGVSILTEEEQAVLDIIEENHPETDSWIEQDEGKTLWVQLHTEIMPGFIETAFDTTEAIFKETKLDEMAFDTVVFQLINEDDDARCRLIFTWYSWSDSPYMACTGSCSGGLLDTYYEDFRNEAESRHFFSKREFAMYGDMFGG